MTDVVARLVLLRHAKASWEHDVADHERPLTSRGHRDASAAGVWLLQAGVEPDLVLCSSAIRTRETWAGVMSAGVDAGEVRYTDDIYAAPKSDLLELLQQVPVGTREVLLIGHAPGVPSLATSLASDDSDPVTVRRLETRFPTCGLAVFEVTVPWAELAPKAATLMAFEVPR